MNPPPALPPAATGAPLPPIADFKNLAPFPHRKNAAHPGNALLLFFALAALGSVAFLAWRLFS